VGVLSAGLLGGLLLLVIHLLRENAPSHVFGLVQRLCTTAPHVVMDLASLVLALVPAVVFGVLLVAAVATWRRTSLLVDCMLADRLDELPPSVSAAARDIGLPASRVVVFQCPELVVFAHGCFRRSVLISTSVLDELSAEELRAVLAHEAEHVRQWDPLRRWVTEVLARGMFLFPVVSDLRDHFVLTSEIEADEAAIRATSREALAGAIVKFVDAPQITSVAAITSGLDAGERIAHLVQPDRPWPRLRASRTSLMLSVGNAVLLTGLAVLLSVLPSM